MVAVLATLFGAVLPYLQIWLAWEYTMSRSPGFGSQEIKKPIGIFQQSNWMEDSAIVSVQEDMRIQDKVRFADSHLLRAPRTVWEGLGPTTAVSHLRYGWPFRSIYCYSLNQIAPVYSEDWGGSAIRPGLGYGPWIIPLRVLWLGMCGNILLSVFLIAVPYFLYSRTRAQRRMVRGLCWKCRYPLTGAETCPECGVGVKA